MFLSHVPASSRSVTKFSFPTEDKHKIHVIWTIRGLMLCVTMPRSSKQGNDTAVQGTNDSSIVSKCSIVSQGYFQDDFLQRFISKTARRTPLINRGYYIRASVIDHVLKQFLSVHCDKNNQIISLGAGFDSAFFRLHANGHLVNTTFYEVDFPDVVQRKATIIRNSPLLRQQLIDEVDNDPHTHSGIYLTSAKYHLLGIDLTNLHFLEKYLTQAGADHQLPTLLLSECVLTYMEVKCSNAVIQWASSSFPNAVFLTYEQIHPDDAFGLVMINHFDKLNSSLKAIRTYPTIKAQQQRFHTLGWQGTSAIDMNSYYYTRLPLKEKQRIEGLEPFDEFEEWHLKCSHYAVVAGCNGNCNAMMKCFGQDAQICSTEVEKQCIPENPYISLLQTPSPISTPPSLLRRYGHASCLISSDRVIVIGGFGEAGSKHARLGDVVILNVKSGTWDTVRASSGIQELEPKMHHTLTAISGVNQFFLFGGRSSPTRPTNSSFIITLNTEHQVKKEKSINQDKQTITEETSLAGVSTQISLMQPSNIGSSVTESRMRDGVPGSRAETACCVVTKEGSELNGCKDRNGSSNSTDHCELTSLESIDATLSCKEQFSIMDELGVQSEKNGTDSHSINSLESREGCISKQSQVGAQRNDDSKSTYCPMMRFPLEIDKASHSNANKHLLPTATKFVSFTYHLVQMQSGDIPKPRWRHSAVHAIVNGKEYVVIYGGRSTDDYIFGDCWLFDVGELNWQKLDITGNQPPCCHSHTACVWQDAKMIIAGGLGPNLQPLSSVHIIDLKTKICQEIELTPRLTPRYSHTAHVMYNSLLLVGGVNPHGAHCYSLVIIDLQSATWYQHSLPACDVERPLMIHNHTSEMLTDSSILILGGGGNCFSFGTHLNNTPVQINLTLQFQQDPVHL